MQKKYRIAPTEAPKFLRRVLDSIIDVLKNPTAQYTAEPGLEKFSKIEGKHQQTPFVVKHIIPTRRDADEQLYVSYGDYEFYVDVHDMNTNGFFEKANALISKKFLYDLNSKTYVPRPVELTFFQDIAQWMRSKLNTKTK